MIRIIKFHKYECLEYFINTKMNATINIDDCDSDTVLYVCFLYFLTYHSNSILDRRMIESSKIDFDIPPLI